MTTPIPPTSIVTDSDFQTASSWRYVAGPIHVVYLNGTFYVWSQNEPFAVDTLLDLWDICKAHSDSGLQRIMDGMERAEAEAETIANLEFEI